MQSFFEILPQKQNTAVALGFFDGLHIGHRNVIMRAVNEKKNGLLPVCFTFLQRPTSVLKSVPACALMTQEDKIKTLDMLGVECTYQADFREVMNLSARDFVKEILIDKLKSKKLFCGFNYRFGKNSEGDVEVLKSLCDEFEIELCVVEPIEIDGEIVSSTLIRNLIQEGNIKKANALLCSEFGFCAEIKHGQRLGRELGTPTINQPLIEELAVPKFGVYVSRVTLENGEKYCGVSNVGIKPTVGGKIPLCETWMPEYKGGEIYGQCADVRLLDFIRAEKKFSGIDELKQAILDDGEVALAFRRDENK